MLKSQFCKYFFNNLFFLEEDLKKLPQKPILPAAIKPEKPEAESQIVKSETKSQIVKSETKSQIEKSKTKSPKVKSETKSLNKSGINSSNVKFVTKSQNPDLEPPLLEPNYPDSEQSDSGKTLLNIHLIIYFFYLPE